MANEDNIIFEIKLDRKSAKGLEDHTKILKKFIEQMKKTGMGGSGGSGGSGGKIDYDRMERLEKLKTKNIQDELEREHNLKDINREKYDLNRREIQAIKTRDLQLAREVRVKDRMRAEETRHWNSIIERMVSGTMGTKAMGMGMMGVKGGIGAAKGLGQLGMKGLGKTGSGQAFALEAGLAKEGDFARGYEGGGAVANLRDKGKISQQDVGNKRASIQGNKLANAFTKTLGKTKAFGDKMGGMSGKTAKGLGMGAIGGLGIAGGVITKAIESSPIAQSMMKIMSTAFTLILRPIGDFFGGVMKPIALRLLKFGAENVGAGANLFKMGEKVGIAALAFFTDPAQVLGLLVERLGKSVGIEIEGFFNKGFDKAAAYEKLFVGFDTKMEEIAGVTGGFESLVTQASQQVISGIDNVNKTTQEGFAEIISKTDEAAKKLEEKQNRESGIFGGYGSKDEQQSELERLMAESKEKYGTAWANAESGMGDSRGGQGMSDSHAEAYLGATDKVKEILETINTGLGDEAVEIIATFEMMKEAGILGNEKQTELREQFAKASEEGTALYADIEQRNTAHEKIMMREEKLQHGMEEKITKSINKVSEDMGVAASILAATIVRMKALNRRTSTRTTRSNKNATGGMITEPVIGIGQHTGETWSFGERGMEYVTPNTALGGRTNNYDQKNNVTINITIEKVTGNTDLQQIKPIVERALRESHSRRGMI
jgi:hypothetical protein